MKNKSLNLLLGAMLLITSVPVISAIDIPEDEQKQEEVGPGLLEKAAKRARAVITSPKFLVPVVAVGAVGALVWVRHKRQRSINPAGAYRDTEIELASREPGAKLSVLNRGLPKVTHAYSEEQRLMGEFRGKWNGDKYLDMAMLWQTSAGEIIDDEHYTYWICCANHVGHAWVKDVVKDLKSSPNRHFDALVNSFTPPEPSLAAPVIH